MKLVHVSVSSILTQGFRNLHMVFCGRRRCTGEFFIKAEEYAHLRVPVFTASRGMVDLPVPVQSSGDRSGVAHFGFAEYRGPHSLMGALSKLTSPVPWSSQVE